MSARDNAGSSDKTIVTSPPTEGISQGRTPASSADEKTIMTAPAAEPTIMTASVAEPTIMTASVAEPTIVTAPAPTEPAAPAAVATKDSSRTVAATPSSKKAQSDRDQRDGMEGKRMSLLEHLSELRLRLRNAAIAFVLAMIGSFYFVEKYFDFLTRPVRKGMMDAGHQVNFYAKSLTEPFWVYMKLAIVGGLIIAGPLVFWEVWKFVAPGLYRKEKRLALLITVSTAFCFAGGAVFAYFVLSEPAAYYLTKLLTSFSGTLPFRLDPMIMMDEVANFQMLTLAGCGVAFELPVVLSILGWMGLISSRGLFKFNRYALVLAVVLGGVLTPSTDPFTQCLLAGPIFGLYNLSILVVWLIERAARRRNEALDKGTAIAAE